MVYKFCPACGDKLPQDGTCKFCPHCGHGLPVQDSGAASNDKTVRRNSFRSPVTTEERSTILTSQNQLSVVLKSSSNKERLACRLSQVLKRTATATRMAVDLAPCLILYKSKAEDVKTTVAIFEEEGSAYTVIAGDFEASTPVEQLIAGYNQLDRETQVLLQATPPALWLGEDIRAIIPDAELENERGLLVITGKNLCFLSSQVKDGRSRWQITPHSRIAEVIEQPEDNGGHIEVIYREFGREDLFHIADEVFFLQACDELRKVLGQRMAFL